MPTFTLTSATVEPIVTTTTAGGTGVAITTGNINYCGPAIAALPSTSMPVCLSSPTQFAVMPGTLNIDVRSGTAYVVTETVPGDVGNGTTSTTTSADTLTITPVTQVVRVDQSQTVVNRQVANGRALFQGVAADDPRAVLGATRRNGPGAIAYGAPVLVGTNQTVQASFGPTVYSPVSATTTVSPATTAIGPATLTTGNVSYCGPAYAALPSTTRPTCITNPTAFNIIQGTINIDVKVATDYVVAAVTTETDTVTGTTTYNQTGTVVPVGPIHAAVPLAAFDQSDRFGRRLLDAAGEAAPILNPFATGATPGPRALADRVERPAVAAPSPWRAFAEGWGFTARTGRSGDVPGNSRDAAGFDGGLAYVVDPTLKVGVAFDYGHTSLGVRSTREAGEADLFEGGLFASYRSGAFVGSLAVVGGAGGADTRSSPLVFPATASGHDGLSFGGIIGEAGWRMPMGAWTLTPVVGGSYTHVELGRFAETGSLLDLRSGGAGLDRGRVWAGLKAETAFDLAGHDVTLAGYARAVGLLGDRRIRLAVAFEAGGGPLAIEGPGQGAIGGDFGASLSTALTGRVRAYLAYDARLRDNSFDQTFRGGVALAW